MSARFAVSDVEVEVEGPEALPNGDTTTPPPPDSQKKMDFLTVSGARDNDNVDNVERNQFTVTSTASGNLALYYEVG